MSRLLIIFFLFFIIETGLFAQAKENVGGFAGNMENTDINLITKEIVADLGRMSKEELNGAIIMSDTGVPMYTPDGIGSYKALWVRDFTYMMEYAGDLMPKESVKSCIEYLLSHTDTNGWIPDRVAANGYTDYAAGDGSFGKPNLDNAAFIVIAVDNYLNGLKPKEAKAFFSKWESHLERGLTVLPKDKKGLIYNDPKDPHSPYGFTDTIGKTGDVLMESLLLWQAYGVMEKLSKKYGYSFDDYVSNRKLIEKNLLDTFSHESGMLLAATVDCRQIDVWGSAYAVYIDFPMVRSQKEGISKWLIKNYTGIVQDGQIRHLPAGEYWDRILLPGADPQGAYQNGAYWATATGWVAVAINIVNPHLAQQTILDAYNYFKTKGIYECVNGDYTKVKRYVVSITNVYGAAKNML